jgi:hypothetical protein
MYIAELHGKFHPNEERKEDILTSNVFSFFKYAKREVFLNDLLSLLGIQVEKAKLADAVFNFWPSYEDGTEPDLVVIVGNYYLLFEAKFHSGFGTGLELDKYQVLREIKGGELEALNMGKEFKFIAVTAHYAKHKFIEENPYINTLNYQWINWHQIALLVFNVLSRDETLDAETASFAEDLYALLLRMNLRKFAGIEVLTSLENFHSLPENLFFDPTTSEYRGDFIGFIKTLSLLPKIFPTTESIIFRRKPTYFSFTEKEYSIKKIDTIFFER